MAQIRSHATVFQEHCAGQTSGGNVFSTSVNRDGTINILKNGVRVARCFWPASRGGAVTDANPTGDRVIVFSLDGTSHGIVDAQAFISGLR